MPHYSGARVRSWFAATAIAGMLLAGAVATSPASAASTPSPTPAVSATPTASPSATPAGSPTPTASPSTSNTAAPVAPSPTPSTPPTESPAPPVARAAAATGSISGTVTLPAGLTSTTPLRVDLQQVGSSVRIPAVVSGSPAGPLTYSAANLAAGSYTVRVYSTSEDSVPLAPQWWQNAATRDAATPVVLAAGENRSGIDFVAQKLATVSGKITTPSGVARTLVTVTAVPLTAGGRNVTARPAYDGTYTLRGLTPGDYRVSFTEYGGRVATQWWNNAAVAADAATIRLASGAARTGVDAALVAPASISGTVTIPSWVDRSAGTITVDVLRAGSPDTLYARTPVVMASLTYSVGGLPPGSYKLRFGSTGLPVQTQWWKGAKGPADATAVVVGAGQNVTVNPSLAEASYAAISGTVTLPAGTSFSDGTVTAQIVSVSTGAVVREEKVQSDGTYIARLLDPGVYRVRIVAEGVRVFPKWWTKSYGEYTDITLGTNQKFTGVDVALVPFSAISGRVRLPEGVSYRDGYVVVDVYSKYNQIVASAVVTPGGTYVVDGLRADTGYYVRFSSPNLPVRAEYYDNATAPITAKRLNLAAGQTLTDITAKLGSVTTTNLARVT